MIIALEGNSESCYASTEHMCDKSEAKHMDIDSKGIGSYPRIRSGFAVKV